MGASYPRRLSVEAMRRLPLACRRARFVLFIGLLILSPANVRSQQAKPNEYQIKAVYLYNFSRCVRMACSDKCAKQFVCDLCSRQGPVRADPGRHGGGRKYQRSGCGRAANFESPGRRGLPNSLRERFRGQALERRPERTGKDRRADRERPARIFTARRNDSVCDGWEQDSV